MTSAGSETLTNDPSNGLLAGTTLGAVSDSYGYSQFAEMSSYSATSNATPVFATSFIRDKLGRITQKTETVNAVTHVYDYTYDPAGRLETVSKDSVLQNTYSYDSNSNRLNNSAVYDDQDRLTSTATATYTYTDNGELLTKVEGADTTSYVYDVLGNLTQVTLPNGDVIDYVIDGRNRRVGKKRNGVLEAQWLYKDQLNPIAELDGAGVLVSRFIYASRANVPDFIIKGGTTYRVISDHLGSPRFVIDTSNGTTAQELDYDEWGNVLFDTNPGFQPFAFAGGHYDQDTQLTRFGARDYDATIGRWTSKDPIGFRGEAENLYGYTFNDSINLIDLTGQSALFSSSFPWTRFGGRTAYPKYYPPRNLPTGKNQGKNPQNNRGNPTRPPGPNRDKINKIKATGKAAKKTIESIGKPPKDFGQKPDLSFWDLIESFFGGSAGTILAPGTPYPGSLNGSCSPGNLPEGGSSNYDPNDIYDPRNPYYDPYAT